MFLWSYRHENGTFDKLSQQNVDTGMGLERTLTVLNGYDSVYDTDLFSNLKLKLEELSNMNYESNQASFRIIMDHIRSATFILGDYHGIKPANTGAGYVLRRLIRRAISHLKKLNVADSLPQIAGVVIADYKDIYPELDFNKDFILTELALEENKFNKTLASGERLFNKVARNAKGIINGIDAFKLFDTFGFPLEFTIELAKEQGLEVDVAGFKHRFKEHQEISRTIDAGAFKGGLADQGTETVKYHTLAHILLASLQKMYGKEINQKGCNITSERIRFDFNLDHKMTEEEKEELTLLVNDTIKKNLPVTCTEMSYEEAKKMGAHGTFEDKYSSVVKVYQVGDISIEICGGPHVSNTSEIGAFKIIKEESSSAGVRRIKAILE